jgi:hypothetical protein
VISPAFDSAPQLVQSKIEVLVLSSKQGFHILELRARVRICFAVQGREKADTGTVFN